MSKLSRFKFGFSGKKVPEKRVFHFFETVVNSVFITITGLFFTLFLIILGVSILFLKSLFVQMIVFLFLGFVFFVLSHRYFLKNNGRILRNLTYENFLISRKKLCSWIIWTFNFYLLFCWFVLIVLGSSNGFGWQFPTHDNQLVLIVTDSKTTKVLGFVLLCVHMFLLVLVKVIIYYWGRIFAFAVKEFDKRRKILESVRNKARLSQ